MSTTPESDERRYIRILRQQVTDLRTQARSAEDDLRDLRERAAAAMEVEYGLLAARMIDALPLTVDTP
ncbi:hypothetical protein [Nocardiopsis tropica]|uniref:Uncharacterized protein n=1 Tax=Nocardiopsis tropica TaxID=109330 RepID=A0ABU7KZR5_9ACTN|nr:hypothetical protein [Nocardiopsis umidischolae]MEE2054768.1 hypothetical protein [Nocardiopsis umidischolae]